MTINKTRHPDLALDKHGVLAMAEMKRLWSELTDGGPPLCGNVEEFCLKYLQSLGYSGTKIVSQTRNSKQILYYIEDGKNLPIQVSANFFGYCSKCKNVFLRLAGRSCLNFIHVENK